MPGKQVGDYLPIGTRTGSGQVVKHDLTRYGLGRLCVEAEGMYPDLLTWLEVLRKNGKRVLLYHYSERNNKSFSGFLWLFYK